jgi:hypothetical protein
MTLFNVYAMMLFIQLNDKRFLLSIVDFFNDWYGLVAMGYRRWLCRCRFCSC